MANNLASQKKELTEMQELFVDELMSNGGDVNRAMTLAGYKRSS